jgi:hypothetical protein
MNAAKKKPDSGGRPGRPSTSAIAAAVLVGVSASAAAGACLLWIVLAPGGHAGPTIGAAWIPRSVWIALPLVVLALSVIFQWRIFKRRMPSAPASIPAPAAAPQDQASQQMREQRLFVYLLRRLQRDGRLMDFLAEDLEAYPDAQIGSAVRSVHAGCRQVVEKLLAPRPVLTQSEQDRVILGADYDPTEVTLTGRVADRPPFEGTVRHTGWRATRIQIPLLAEETDPAILAPAEVEVG